MKSKKFSYKKPTIKTKKVKMNFFQSNSRIFDSFDELLAPNVFAQSGCGCSCFIKGTKVLTKNNTLKPIEEVKSGDIIISFNTRENKLTANTVEKKLTHYGYDNGYILLNDSLKVTPNHPMWLPDLKKWQRADALKIGDKFLNSDGELKMISSIKVKNGNFDVYNLHMTQSPHNFFADGYLVHNQISTANNKDC